VLPYICVSSKRRRRRHAFLEYVFDSGRRAARYRVPIHLNGRRPRGRGGRVGRVWRTTVVHRTHSVNSYVAVLHALYASGAGPAPGRADVACVYRGCALGTCASLPVRTSGTCVTVTGTYATVTYGLIRTASAPQSVRAGG
jgi:hypothetical protein